MPIATLWSSDAFRDDPTTFIQKEIHANEMTSLPSLPKSPIESEGTTEYEPPLARE